MTSDNPRTEDPLAIIGEIEGGMVCRGDQGSLSRRNAEERIRQNALSGHSRPARGDRRGRRMARPGDVVVLAGKGHEDYQIIGETKIHFDDREVAREEIRKSNAECGDAEQGYNGRRVKVFIRAVHSECPYFVIPHLNHECSDKKLLEEILGRVERMEIKGVSIDSRTIKEGELFVALKGDRFDGHDFVPDAIKTGGLGRAG